VTAGRERLVAVLVLAALGAAAVLASTQTWVAVQLPNDRPLAVPGSSAAPALAPLGLVLLALAAALGIAGRGARLLLAAVAVLLGAGLGALAVPVLADPVGAASGAVTAATGIAGAASVRGAISAAAATGWPAVAAVVGALAALTGILLAVRSRRWPSGGRRYRPSAPRAATTDPVEEWDALTAGDDPTAVPGEGPGTPGPGGPEEARP
jgi:uncharacterized membrane protein (TIGR02234 family)